ncbi:MAG: PP2C family serine/threonine-protein phosphatase [Clostridia bacterium]
MIDYATLTKIGQRNENQDAFGHAGKDGCHCFVVCDGLGGYEKGGIAAWQAVEAVLSGFHRRPVFSEENACNLVNQARDRILELQKEHSCPQGLMTTIALILVGEGGILANHVGDTRIYVFDKDSRTLYQSTDHSLVQAMKEHPQMYRPDEHDALDRNILLRALGMEGGKLKHSVQLIHPEGRAAVLICSDGFWEHLSEYDTTQGLSFGNTAGEWLSRMTKTVESGKTGPNADNYTAIALIL